MIRFLQKDNRVTKALFVVIIAAASVSMVVYLIPGLTGGGAASADTYAMIYPHWYSRFLSSGETVSQQRVEQACAPAVAAAQPAIRRQPDDPELLSSSRSASNWCSSRFCWQRQTSWASAPRDDDVRQYLHTGPTGEVLFPNGKFIGDDQYAALIAEPAEHVGHGV